LQELAEKHQLTRLLSILETHKPQNIRSSVKSVSVEKLKELEENADWSEFPPFHSVGDTLVVAPALTWDAASLPPDTHQCFVGILWHAQDDDPLVPGAYNFDLNDFIAFIRNHNNITWKNFNVVDDVDPIDPSAVLPFNIVGAPDKARKFDFEIIRALPEEASLWLEMPFNLFAFTGIKGIEPNIDRKGNFVSFLLPRLRRFGICHLNLPKSARYKCRFVVKGGKGYENGLHQIAIRQVYENFEVGRVTWGLKVKTENKKRKK
jgi:hypothetical protein